VGLQFLDYCYESYVASSSSVLEDGGLTHLPRLLTSFLLGAVF
jgi:hypothetical protein